MNKQNLKKFYNVKLNCKLYSKKLKKKYRKTIKGNAILNKHLFMLKKYEDHHFKASF